MKFDLRPVALLCALVVASGSARADDVPSVARALWADLAGNTSVVPAFLRLPRNAVTPGRKEQLAILQRAAAGGSHPAAPALHDLFVGLNDLQGSRSWADADVALTRCLGRPGPDDALARAARAACAVYDGLVAAQIGRPRDMLRGFDLATRLQAASELGRIAQLLRGAVGGGYDLTETYLLGPIFLLSAFHGAPVSQSVGRTVNQTIAKWPWTITGAPPAKRLADLERELVTLWRPVGDTPQKRVALALIRRGIARLRATYRATFGDDELPNARLTPGRGSSAAKLHGDWEGRFWEASLADPVAGGDARLSQLATTLQRLLPNGSARDGPSTGVSVWRTRAEVYGRHAGERWEVPLPSRSPGREWHLDGRLPAGCSKPIEALQQAWNACPDNAWRTFSVAYPGESAPIQGGPLRTRERYQRLARAASALPPACKQAIAPRLPVSLETHELTLRRDTALISVKLVDHYILRRVLWTDDAGRTRRADDLRPGPGSYTHMLLSDLARSVAGGTSEPFRPALAHEVYRLLLGDLPPGAAASKHWIAAVQLGPTPLPLELLVSRPSACDAIDPKASAQDLAPSCRDIAWLAEGHDLRYAVDLRDALSWMVLRPHRLPTHASLIGDPVFLRNPDDPRCASNACAGLPTLAERWKRLLAAGRLIDRGSFMTPKAPAPDVLRRLPGTRAWDGALRRLAGAAGWSVETSLGLRADEGALTTALTYPEPSLVVIASHITHPPQSLLDPTSMRSTLQVPTGLVLAPARDGRLAAENDGFVGLAELADRPADYSRVAAAVLSTCSGSAPIALGRLPTRSVASELRIAGVGSVLSHMWPLPDDAGTRPTVEVLREAFASAVPLRVAHSAAVAAWRAEHPHPSRWAHLILHGPGHAVVSSPESPPPVAGLLTPESSPISTPLLTIGPGPVEGRFPWALVLPLLALTLGTALRPWRLRWPTAAVLGVATVAAALFLRLPGLATLSVAEREAPAALTAQPGPTDPAFPKLAPIRFGDGVAFVIAAPSAPTWWFRLPNLDGATAWDTVLRSSPGILAAVRAWGLRPAEDIVEIGRLGDEKTQRYSFAVLSMPDGRGIVPGLRTYATSIADAGAPAVELRTVSPGHFVARTVAAGGPSDVHLWVWTLDWAAIESPPPSDYELDRRALGATHVAVYTTTAAGADVPDPPILRGAKAAKRLAVLARPIGGVLPGFVVDDEVKGVPIFGVGATLPRRDGDEAARKLGSSRSATLALGAPRGEGPSGGQWFLGLLDALVSRINSDYQPQANKIIAGLCGDRDLRTENLLERASQILKQRLVFDESTVGLKVTFRSWKKPPTRPTPGR